MMLITPFSIFSQQGLLDPTFNIGTGSDRAVNAVVVQPDGTILLGGEFNTVNGHSNSFLARVSTDGTVDSAFNPTGQTDGKVTSLLQQSNGKILVTGSFHSILGSARHGLARLNPDGTLDLDFDAGDLLPENPELVVSSVQADGKVLVAWSTNATSQIVRLEPNGALDSSFSFSNQIHGYVLALLPLPDGSTLAGLNYSLSNCITHFDTTGRFDASFDTGLSNSSVLSLTRKPNGQIIVGGYLQWRNATDFFSLLQLNSDLSVDTSFHPDSIAVDTFSVGAIHAVLLQPDGKFVIGGYFFEVGGYWRRHLARMSAEGKVDPCFDPGLGLGGFAQPSPVLALALQTNGFVLVGGVFQGVEGINQQTNLARFRPDSVCGAVRLYLGDPNSGQFFIAASFPPGGTNWIVASTNLVDWTDFLSPIVRPDAPYIFYGAGGVPADTKFYRARQQR